MGRLEWFHQAGLELNWVDIWEGLNAGHIQPQEAVLHAVSFWEQHSDCEDTNIIELASASKDEDDLVRKAVAQLAANEHADKSSAKRKWRYLFLRHVLLQPAKPEDLLVDIERVYADFDYPDEMSHFIYYMPQKQGAVSGSPEEARQQLIGFALEYLRQEGVALGVKSPL